MSSEPRLFRAVFPVDPDYPAEQSRQRKPENEFPCHDKKNLNMISVASNRYKRNSIT